ncbi:hypothetical protein MAH_1658 [Mycobacterium rhizamassiliense]|uniref:Uncharacterized protein n=1 Tax=Mycobacterium rhizamassiliense TaxID=1841860 RepID=A0A2U3NWU1_9MYCO|nr:hypothetical protein MAH_1658 [Mycobacterium rhizamassiliense]
MLLPLGSPLPDDSVLAVRGESGLLGSLSVPLVWGVAVPPDDYDHWAPVPQDGADVEDTAGSELSSEEWGQFTKLPRRNGVVPHSPAAG